MLAMTQNGCASAMIEFYNLLVKTLKSVLGVFFSFVAFATFTVHPRGQVLYPGFQKVRLIPSASIIRVYYELLDIRDTLCI
jgi:hypothetical protein